MFNELQIVIDLRPTPENGVPLDEIDVAFGGLKKLRVLGYLTSSANGRIDSDTKTYESLADKNVEVMVEQNKAPEGALFAVADVHREVEPQTWHETYKIRYFG